MIVCDKGHLGVALPSGLLSCDESVSQVEDMPLGGSVFRQIKGVQRKPLPAFAGCQVPKFKITDTLRQHSLGWLMLLPFT